MGHEGEKDKWKSEEEEEKEEDEEEKKEGKGEGDRKLGGPVGKKGISKNEMMTKEGKWWGC